MKGINCNIVKDLLPSYVDKICTEDSRRLIEEHIGGCEQCRTQLKLLQGTELTDEQGEQRRISYLKKLKRHYEKGITSLVLLTLAIIGASLFLVGHNDRNLLYVIFPLSLIAAYGLMPGSPLAEQLLGYLDNSTVYSRENVLSALYALGNIQSIEHAFILMSQRGWYHDPRLLSDGLSRFQGDKNPLASRLWGCRSDLAECFQVGIVRFADSLTGDGFAEDFLRELELEELPAETRFTLVRYFRRHAIPGAQPMLLLLLGGGASCPSRRPPP